MMLQSTTNPISPAAVMAINLLGAWRAPGAGNASRMAAQVIAGPARLPAAQAAALATRILAAHSCAKYTPSQAQQHADAMSLAALAALR